MPRVFTDLQYTVCIYVTGTFLTEELDDQGMLRCRYYLKDSVTGEKKRKRGGEGRGEKKRKRGREVERKGNEHEYEYEYM